MSGVFTAYFVSFTVQLEQFHGPLDALLQLIEKERLEITEISLTHVTETFVTHMRAHESSMTSEELLDFLLVASRLIYLKARILLPDLYDREMEDAGDLAEQLRTYQAFIVAAEHVGSLFQHGLSSWGHERPVRYDGYVAATEVRMGDPQRLQQLFRAVIQRIAPPRFIRTFAERTVTIEQKIHELQCLLVHTGAFSFQTAIQKAYDRTERIVSFLALLELIKQRLVIVRQDGLFAEIHVRSYDPRSTP